MTGKLTTHVLDTALGVPAEGIVVTLDRFGGKTRERVASATTNADGRLDTPLMEGAGFYTGEYEIVFRAGQYLRSVGHELPDPAFLDDIPIRFGIADETHYHVPLLLSPYGYSTYRGS